MNLEVYVNPEYAELILRINKLKKEATNKIVEKEWLSKFIFPEIKNSYILKFGLLELDLYTARLNLDKINRKINLCKEALNFNNTIDEEKIDQDIEKEFKNRIHEYKLLQKDVEKAIEYTKKDKIDGSIIEKMNDLYKDLVFKLNPILNPNNSVLENELYELSEKAYIDRELNKMVEINLLCIENSITSNFVEGELEELKKLEKIFNKVIEENKYLILNIRSSEMFSNKYILENENLVRRKKTELQKEINQISLQYTEALNVFKNLKKRK